MKQTTIDFLNRHMIDPKCFSTEKITSEILEEMEKGLAGKKSSLKMINSFCSSSFTLVPDEKVLVIDAGGTNLRTCLVHFNKKQEAVIEDFRKSTMPGTDREVSAKEFFTIMADEIMRLIDKADKIGFCFSYPARILEDHDGIPVLLSKEIKAPEVVGKHIGKELLKELASRGKDIGNKKIMILNDTVTTLLAGLSETSALGCEGCVGFVLGTGTNTAYSEKGIIINEESGGFSFAPGDIDRAFIAQTANPEVQFFEKLISGTYLGPLALTILREAEKEKVITSDLPDSFKTTELSEALEKQNLDPDVMDILNAFIERVAVFVSANLCASVIKSGFGKDKPCLINADGSTFCKIEMLKKLTIEYTDKTLASQGYSAKFTTIDNAPIIGSAIGALGL